MIIEPFTYGLLEGKLFRKLVGWEWVNIEEMICKVNRFLRQEAKKCRKGKNGWQSHDGKRKFVGTDQTILAAVQQFTSLQPK